MYDKKNNCRDRRGGPRRAFPLGVSAPSTNQARERERQLYQMMGIRPARDFYFNRLARAIGFWRQIGASSEILRWIREGVPVNWVDQPPLPFHHGNCLLTGEPLAAWTQLRVQYLWTGAIRPARDPRFVSRAFLVPKKDLGYRLVVDLRHLNSHCRPWHTRFETLGALIPQIRQGMFFIGWDIRDAFHHLRVEAKATRYFAFQINGETFECPGLCFGWLNSPHAFTKLMHSLVAFI